MSKSVIFTIIIVYCYNIYNKHYYCAKNKTKKPPNLTNKPTKCKILYLILLTVLILMYRRFSRHVQESSKFYIHYSKQFAQRTFISYHVYTMVCGWQNALEHWLPVSVEFPGLCSRLTAWANVQVISECLTLRHTCLPSHVSFLVKGQILITSDWELWSHLARWSLCPGVETNCTAMAGVLLWLSLSFNRYLDPGDTRWKVPKATLNYVYFSAPAVYTTRHREPFPAKTPLAAAYCGNISTDCKQNGYGLEADYLSDLISVIKHKVLVEDRWFFF